MQTTAEPLNPGSRPVSVVIATLGGDSLAGVISQLNESAPPAEILICIPEAEAGRAAALRSANVQVMVTPRRGQVAQRAYGLRCVSQPIVLQLDDDILLRPADFDQLMLTLERLGPGNAVAPVICDLNRRCLHAYRDGLRGWLQSLHATVICGAPWGLKRMGTVSPAGVSYGVSDRYCRTDPVAVDWLPGGCVLSYRQDLVRDSFFPFCGKAYSEDILHSLLRQARGIRSWIVPTSRCMTPPGPAVVSRKELAADFRVRRHVVRMRGGSMLRFRLSLLSAQLKRMAHLITTWRR
jgi:glycosyltransferase involved in cell wall biosynthesis